MVVFALAVRIQGGDSLLYSRVFKNEKLGRVLVLLVVETCARGVLLTEASAGLALT